MRGSNMQKIKFGKNVYYYDERVVGKVFQDALYTVEAGSKPNMSLMQYANIVVDTHSNTVLKCRYSIEELVDSYVKHN
jgi:hypothetical protein